MSLSETLPPGTDFLLLELGDVDALPPQCSVGCGLAGCLDLAAHHLAGLVLAFPGKIEFLRTVLFLCLACCGHRLLPREF